MNAGTRSRSGRTIVVTGLMLALMLAVTRATYGGETSAGFSGHHVNSGTVTHEISGGKHLVTMSRDFPVPEALDPHWRIVDSKGNLYLF